jgi:DNA-binding NarL/FixJ family response regulator
VRVAIADDSSLVREGLARLLSERGVEVCALASDGDGLLRAGESEHPDVAVTDIRMPPTHTDEGLVAAERIRATYDDVGVLVLSQYAALDYALRLLDGHETRCGYLLKDRVTEIDVLLEALRRVDAGDLVVDHGLVEALLARRERRSPLDGLTARESEVLALMAEGLTDRGIAERLWLTPRTVETHVRHIIRKLDLPNDAAHNRRVHAVLTYLARR